MIITGRPILLQIPAEEYSRVMRHLMADVEFRCHVCCHNVIVAVIIFAILLCLCLVLQGYSRSFDFLFR